MGFATIETGVHLPFPPEVTVPDLVTVELPHHEPPAITGVAAAVEAAVVGRFAGTVAPGMTIALGAGSRGLTARVEMLQGAVRGFRKLGAEPFVVPAMGSHGGATAEGQLEVLSGYGITESRSGARSAPRWKSSSSAARRAVCRSTPTRTLPWPTRSCR